MSKKKVKVNNLQTRMLQMKKKKVNLTLTQVKRVDQREKQEKKRTRREKKFKKLIETRISRNTLIKALFRNLELEFGMTNLAKKNIKR